MTTHRLNIVCPYCQDELDAQTVIKSKDPRPPQPGDFGLCFSCGEWHIFETAGVRKPDDDEQTTIGTDSKFRTAREAWLEVVLPRVKASTTVNGVRWEALTEDYPDLGNLPDFLRAHDDRRAVEQLDAGYKFAGGWNPIRNFKYNKETQALKYPGDPQMRPLARATLRDEVILLYPSSWVVVAQKSGAFECARLD
jgi:hypothetical protein